MDSQKNGKTLDVYVLPTKSSEQEKPARTESFWHINKEMLRFKIHYFLFVGGIAAGIPYAVVFAKDRLGISATSLGAVLTTQMFLFIFTKTVIGYLADYLNKLKEMITVLAIMYTACYFLLLTLPPIEVETFHNASDTAKGNFSVKCNKYRETFSKTIFQNFENVTDLETSNVSYNLLLNEFQRNKSACYPFTEDDFENVILSNLNEFSSKQSYKDSLHFKNISSKLMILIILTLPSQEKLCFSNPDSQNNFTETNIANYGFEDQCIFESSLTARLNSETYDSVELHCALCQGKNSTLERITEKNTKKKDTQTYQFWLFTLIYTISGVSLNAIFTLSDTALFESIQKHGGSFGQQRLWGGIGWGAIAPLAGFINDYTEGFLWSYVLQGSMMMLFLWNMSKIDLVKPHFSKNILKDVGTVLRSKDFLIFEVMVFLNGLGTGMIWYYLIWFLISIGGSDLLCGLTLTVQSFVGVIPFMFFSGWIIQKIGHFNVLIVGLAGYTVRFLWYSYLQNPWLVLPVEFLHGITYGLYYPALASYAKLSAKPGTEATTQAIIFSTHEGLGSGIGCVVSGIGFDHFGGHQTFFYSSMICLCGAFLGLFLSLHLQRRKKTIQVAAE